MQCCREGFDQSRFSLKSGALKMFACALCAGSRSDDVYGYRLGSSMQMRNQKRLATQVLMKVEV